MTLIISPKRGVSMAQRRQENNPLATYASYVGTITSNRSVEEDGALVNASDGGTYSYWVPNTAGQTSATYVSDLGASKSVNFVGIVSHNLGTSGASIVVAYASDGSNWTDVEVDNSPTTDDNIGMFFEDIEARYWRVSLTFPTSSALLVGVVSFGAALVFPTRIYQGYTPPLQATSVEQLGNVTEGGNYIGTAVVRRGQAASFGLNYLKPEFVRGVEMQAFQSWFNAGKPFFWSWRPLKYGDTLYAWRTGATIVPTNSGPNDLMSFSASVRAYDDKS